MRMVHSESSDPNNYFTEMTTIEKVLQCLLCLVELEDLVHYWANLLLAIQTDHFLKSVSGPVQDTLERDISLQCKHIRVQLVF